MSLFESVFDLMYLTLVIALGIRLWMQSDRSAKQFGAMAVLLGLGDSFHLFPRIFAHWTPDGFQAFAPALSYGEAITSVTMTAFYLLLYYYGKRRIGTASRGLDLAVWALVALRIALVLMPQNGWGSADGNYLWAILRNIPFAALGILLIGLCFRSAHIEGMKRLGGWVAASFLFYVPVVLWAPFEPRVGALMIPKTVAYLGIVLTGFKMHMPKFSARSVLENSFVFLLFGLAAGVFYREFTKWFGFTEPTTLGVLHVHTLVLGCLGMLILYGYLRRSQSVDAVSPNPWARPVRLWTAGVTATAWMLTLRGIIQVLGNHTGSIPDAAISGVAGLAHILLAVGLIMTFLQILRTERTVAHTS